MPQTDTCCKKPVDQFNKQRTGVVREKDALFAYFCDMPFTKFCESVRDAIALLLYLRLFIYVSRNETRVAQFYPFDADAFGLQSNA